MRGFLRDVADLAVGVAVLLALVAVALVIAAYFVGLGVSA